MGKPRPSQLPDRLDAILFDAGGVLLDLDYAYLRRLADVQGYTVEAAQLSRAEAVARHEIEKSLRSGEICANPWREYFHHLLAGVGVAGEVHNRIIDALWEAHQRVGLWTVAIPGARKTVVELKSAGYRVGVISNAEGQVARDLDNAGFEGLFETVIDSERVGVSKPDPGIFRIALEQMNLTPETALFVGDMPAIDVDGARAAGLSAVLLDRHGLHTGCDAPTIASISELSDLLGEPSSKSRDDRPRPC